MRPAWRDTENERRRERYADDAAYREKRLAEGRAAYYGNPAPKLERNKRWWAESPKAVPLAQRGKAVRKARIVAAFVDEIVPFVVLERDDGMCGVCGEDVDPTRFDVDHIVPLVEGGLHAYSNVQVAHPTCNRKKGAL